MLGTQRYGALGARARYHWASTSLRWCSGKAASRDERDDSVRSTETTVGCKVSSEKAESVLKMTQIPDFHADQVTPERVAHEVLPWGFVPQDVVKLELVPAARDYSRFSNASMVPMDAHLRGFDLSVNELEEGIASAYRFVTSEFSKGEPVFETEHKDTVEPGLASAYDAQLRQLGRGNSGIEVHEVHSVEVINVQPALHLDRYAPENLAKFATFFSLFGVNRITVGLYSTMLMLNILNEQRLTGEDHGVRVRVDAIVRTSETPSFGPEAGERNDDATHILHFSGGRGIDVLSDTENVSFELANHNCCLHPDMNVPMSVSRLRLALKSLPSTA